MRRGTIGLCIWLAACGTAATNDGGVDASSTDAWDASAESAADASSGTPCTSAGDCSGKTPACDTMKGTCTGCRDDNDCASLHCDTMTGECRDCVDNQHCMNPLPLCDTTTQQCSKACMTDQDCPQGGSTPHRCHPMLKVCVDCYQGQHCGSGFCETVTFSCVGCLKDTDCPMINPVCGPSLDCGPKCTTDQNCPNGLHCDTTKSACAECVTSKHCPGGICQTNQTCG
jgi:hypothetical protein